MARIKVKRAFFERGLERKVGEVIEASASFARELCASNKAQLVSDAAPAAPMTTETAEALVKGKPAKEKPNAG